MGNVPSLDQDEMEAEAKENVRSHVEEIVLPAVVGAVRQVVSGRLRNTAEAAIHSVVTTLTTEVVRRRRRSL